ncbi:DUF1236 domain-containing protein [Bradyrhizobium sp. ARR65]|uniref:DUF1236 domain-containing protein n=1 Tax=Bradyrhizobium sp. ARR65 TaxID=1040989 RepID=UPI00054FEC93|nr:DUF1236 domain-containing protein [Bradyrhizobium sp. ARR65]
MTKWLATTAIVLSIGAASGLAFAQSQPDLPQKREQGAQGLHPSVSPRESGRSAAREERQPGHQQAQEHQQSHETGQTVGQGREPPARNERASQTPAQQGQDQRRGREAQQGAEPTRQQGREERARQGNRAAETTAPARGQQAEREQQTGRNERQPAGANQQSQNQERRGRGAERAAEKQQPARERNEQAAQPARPGTPTAQQGTPPAAQTTGEARQRGTTGQAQNQTMGRAGTAPTRANEQQRTQIVDRLRSDREIERARSDIDIRVNVGERLPERVRPRPLPPDIVNIAPEYRGYDYTVVQDEVAIIDPRSREIVDVIPERGFTAENSSRYEGTRVVLSSEQRQILKRTALSSMTVGSAASTNASNTACLTLQPVPDELVRSNPELAAYRYVAIGDQVVLVDPRERKIVQVID